MKKLFIIFSIIIPCQISFGQEFSFSMYFEDAAGFKDTIVLGYDVTATDTVDVAFGEVNIINEPLDTFDVRITDEHEKFKQSDTGTFHLKKQIIYWTCEEWNLLHPISIDIKCSNWPVTTHWNNTLFDGCLEGSVFTSIPSGGWWDAESPSDLGVAGLFYFNKVDFSANWESNVNDNSAYINDSLDTISVFWVVFADPVFIGLYLEDQYFENSYFYPNPSSGTFNISSPESILNMQVFNIYGQQIQNCIKEDKIDLLYYPTGMYFVRMELLNGEVVSKTLVKE